QGCREENISSRTHRMRSFGFLRRMLLGALVIFRRLTGVIPGRRRLRIGRICAVDRPLILRGSLGGRVGFRRIGLGRIRLGGIGLRRIGLLRIRLLGVGFLVIGFGWV